ncbi:MAG: RHS repeat protein [Alphaproteobacteria bacterium]|nr:MAG: RHS repeat protein [Alphaproteobacteria bacterium]
MAFCGNPINAGTGNKFETAVDIALPGHTGLSLARFYNSQDSRQGLGDGGGSFGAGWRSSFDVSVVASGSSAQVARADGMSVIFTKNGSGAWVSEADVHSTLAQNADGTWQWQGEDDNTYRFDAKGRLTSIATRGGLTTSIARTASGALASVTGPFNHKLTFATDAQGRVTSVTGPDGAVTGYGYDANNNLASVSYPGGASRRYVYENASFPHALTGIMDENGARFATWSYDSKGKAISSEHAGGAEKVTVAYGANAATITTPKGSYSYGLTTQFNVTKPTAVTGTPSAQVAAKNATYDSKGHVASTTDFNGNTTTYAHNDRGLETSRTEASGTALARTVTTQWHPTLRLPTQIDEPGRSTRMVYDGKGNMTKRTVSAGGQNWTSTATYTAKNQLASMTSPGGRTTRYEYDAAGGLAKIINAMNHVTQITNDAAGRPIRITDPNGLVTTLEYDARGRLISRSEGTAKTRYEYDAAGQMVRTSLPTGASFTHSYDAAHRLVRTTDALGNSVNLGYDAASNITSREVRDASGAVVTKRGFEHDSRGLMTREIGAYGWATRYDRDANGNIELITDSAGALSDFVIDALNRRIGKVDALGYRTDTAFDTNDLPVHQMDPRGLVTEIQRDGMGRVIAVHSPDSGTTTYTRDPDGNILTKTDARNVTATFEYDALSRVTRADYGNGEVFTYLYDQTAGGVGRLSSVTGPNGYGLTQGYDGQGYVSAQSQQVGGVTLQTSYTRNAAGQVVRSVLPSGKVLDYSYQNGQVAQINADGAALVTGITYQPFGAASGWKTLGLVHQKHIDLDGRVDSIQMHDAVMGLGYLPGGANGRLGTINETGFASQNIGYYPNGWVRSYQGPDGKVENYDYDPSGNRTAQRGGVKGEVRYTVVGNSNQIQSINKGTTSMPQPHDLAGNLTHNGAGLALVYNGMNRVASANGVPRAYDHAGQRVQKGATVYVRGEDGLPMGEYDAGGKALQETVRLDGAPVAVLYRDNKPYAVHPDYRDAPFLVRKADGGMVWGWQGNGAWSDIAPAHYQTGLRGMFDYTHALPGQIVDSDTPSLNPESPVRDNGARLMDPNTGRFLQVDPVLQRDGVSPYAFNDPVNFVDVDGRTADPIGYAGGMTASQLQDAYGQAQRDYTRYQADMQRQAAIDAIPFNPAKGASAVGNYVQWAANMGLASFNTSIGNIPTALWNTQSGVAAWRRGAQQWDESICESWGQARLKNLNGMLPWGTEYDDPNEPSPVGWVAQKGNAIGKFVVNHLIP